MPSRSHRSFIWSSHCLSLCLFILLAGTVPPVVFAADHGLTPPCAPPTAASLFGVASGDPVYGLPGEAISVSGQSYDYLVRGRVIPLLQLYPPQPTLLPDPPPQPLPIERGTCQFQWVETETELLCETNCSHDIQELTISSTSSGPTLKLTEPDRIGLLNIQFWTGVSYPPQGTGFEWNTATVPDGIYTIRGRAYQDPLTLDFECTKCFWAEVQSNTIKVRVLNESEDCTPPSTVTVTQIFATGSGTVSDIPTQPGTVLVTGLVSIPFSVVPGEGTTPCDFAAQTIITNLATGQQTLLPSAGLWDTTLFGNGTYTVAIGVFPTGEAFFSKLVSAPLRAVVANELSSNANAPINQDGDVGSPDPTDPNAIPSQSPLERKGADPVDFVTGALYASERDASVPSVGHTVSLWRFYNSRITRQGSFGRGWSSLYERFVEFAPSGDLIEHDGRGVRYRFPADGNGGYLAAAGYEGAATRDAGGVTIRHARGTTYRYGLSGELLTIRDANNNTLSFSYVSGLLQTITEPSGRQLTFSNNGTRITSAILPNGDVHAYQYDAAGRLSAHVDPRGNTTTYTYHPDGTLQSIRKPSGATTTFTYSDGRVTQVQDPGGAPTTFAYDTQSRLTVMTDPLGNQTRVAYDLFGNITSITDPLGGVKTRQYDEKFRPVQLVDPRGAVTAFSYDASGNVTRVVDPLSNATTITIHPILARPTHITGPRGELTQIEYDGSGNTTAITNPTGGRVELTYDSRGLPQTLRDARLALFQFEHDTAGNLTSILNPAGQRTQIAYDSIGRTVRVTDALGRVTQVAYHVGSLPSRIVDALGGESLFVYDGDLNPTTVTRPNGATTRFAYGFFGFQTRVTSLTDALSNVTQFEYDTAGQLTRIVAPLNRIQQMVYDANGRLTRITDPTGGIRTFAYDTAGNQTHTVSPNGYSTLLTYDLVGRLTKIEKPLVGLLPQGPTGVVSSTFTYDASGNLISRRDPIGSIHTTEYDLAGRPIRLIDPLNRATSRTYDANGNITQSVDPNGGATTFAYDVLNRLVRKTDPLGNSSTFGYDSVGNIIEEFDPNGNRTQFAYDALNRRIRITNAMGGITGFEYDSVGNLLRLTDANGRATSFIYDLMSRELARTDPLGNSRSNIYDAAGRVIQVTDEDGQVSTLTYDLSDRMLSRSSTADPSSNLSYISYDANGNLLNIRVNASDVFTYTEHSIAYDELDRITGEFDNLNGYRGVSNHYSVLDGAGNRILHRRFPDPGYSGPDKFSSTTYTYNSASQLVRQVTGIYGQSAIYSFDFSYDPAGRLLAKTYSNGTAVVYGYDAAHRVTSIQNIAGSKVLSKHLYTYDGAGNVRTHTDEFGTVDTYTYDALHRLIGASRTGSPPTEYAYDAVGNRLRKTVGSTNTLYSYDAANRLLTAGLDQFTYDRRGNQISRISGSNELRLTYTLDSQIRTATTLRNGRVQSQESYRYNGLGGRVYSNGPSGHFAYTYDGSHVLERYPVNTQGDIGLRTAFIRDTSGAPLLQLPHGSGTIYFSYQDLLGSNTALAATAGTLKARYSYSEFGGIISGNTSLTPFLFAGMQRDGLTGFSYSFFRHYDPVQGRWTSRDPIGFAGGDANLYGYVSNNPTSYRDPLGLAGQGVVTGFVSAALGGATGAWYGGWSGAWRGALSGAVSGFIAGETFGLVNPWAVGALGGSVKAAVVAGAASGAASGFSGAAVDIAIEQATNNNPCAPSMSAQDVSGRLLKATVLGAALGSAFSGTVSAASAEPAARAYSVAYRYRLPKDAWVGSRSAHRRAFMQELDAQFNAYPEFANGMEGLIPGIKQAAQSLKVPEGWRIHHVAPYGGNPPLGVGAGYLDLIPQYQHTGAAWQHILHPGGKGGFSIWATQSTKE